MRPQLPPERHEAEVGDVTIDQREHGGGSVVRMQSHRPRPPSTALHRQAYFRPIPPLLDRLDDLGVADVELGNPPQRIPHDRLLGGELRLVGDVLQLAAAAVILYVVRTGRGDAGRAGSDDLGQLPAGEALVQLHALAQPDPLAGRGAGDEHGAPVREPAHALPTRRDRRDRHDVAHSPHASRRAASSQGDGRTGGPAGGPAGAALAVARRSSASSAATTASGRTSSDRTPPASNRAPARSKYVTSISPRWNSGSSITRR